MSTRGMFKAGFCEETINVAVYALRGNPFSGSFSNPFRQDVIVSPDRAPRVRDFSSMQSSTCLERRAAHPGIYHVDRSDLEPRGCDNCHSTVTIVQVDSFCHSIKYSFRGRPLYRLEVLRCHLTSSSIAQLAHCELHPPNVITKIGKSSFICYSSL